MAEPTHVGMYLKSRYGRERPEFVFFAGPENALIPELTHHLPAGPQPATRLRVESLPERFREEAGKAWSLPDERSSSREAPVMGWVRYWVKGNVAETESIYPKYYLRHGEGHLPVKGQTFAKGFGTLLEFLAVAHLKTQGVTHVDAGGSEKGGRQAAVARAGLPQKGPVPIDEYLEGLRQSYEKATGTPLPISQ